MLFLAVLILIMVMLLSAPKAHSQAPGVPADKIQTAGVLTGLVNANLVAMGILIGDSIVSGGYGLILADGEKVGLIQARMIGETAWLESLTLTPAAAAMKPSVDPTSLRTKLYLFFGHGKTGWHDGDYTKSVDRQDVWVQRSKRFDDGLVIQYTYSDWIEAPVQLFDLRIIVWPTQ